MPQSENKTTNPNQPEEQSSPQTPKHILVVDDEAPHRASLERIFSRAGFWVTVAPDGASALEELKHQHKDKPIDIILSDLVMPKLDGRQLLSEAKELLPDLPFILMTAYGTIDHAVEAMRLGAHDFLTKPVRRGEVLHTIEKALEHKKLKEENKRLQNEVSALKAQIDGSSFRSPLIQRVEEELARAAPSHAPLLFLGESGTGKEVHARKAHQLSSRKDKPFIAVNCSALPHDLLEAELFGVEKGAFTGADKTRLGRFERADGGTLFLDEIGDMPLEMQAKMLRVLEDGTIERVGGETSIQVDVRLMSATNKDLSIGIRDGSFREDLLYRINVFTITLPPLRDRREDIPALVSRFLEEYNIEHQQQVEIEEAALSELLKRDFPGNIRELRNVVERAAILADDGVITRQQLNPKAIKDTPLPASELKASVQVPIGLAMADIERIIIGKTLEACAGDKNKAASLLQIGLRTLYRKLDSLDQDAIEPDLPNPDGRAG